MTVDFGIVAVLAIQILLAAVGVVAAMRMTAQVERIKDAKADGLAEVSSVKIQAEGLEKRMRDISLQHEAAAKILDEVTAAADRHEEAIANIEERITSMRNSQAAKSRYDKKLPEMPPVNGKVHQEDLVQQAQNGLPPNFGAVPGG